MKNGTSIWVPLATWSILSTSSEVLKDTSVEVLNRKLCLSNFQYFCHTTVRHQSSIPIECLLLIYSRKSVKRVQAWKGLTSWCYFPKLMFIQCNNEYLKQLGCTHYSTNEIYNIYSSVWSNISYKILG